MAHGERAARKSNDRKEWESRRLRGIWWCRGWITKWITHRKERRASRRLEQSTQQE
jgi:hypothetical protein